MRRSLFVALSAAASVLLAGVLALSLVRPRSETVASGPPEAAPEGVVSAESEKHGVKISFGLAPLPSSGAAQVASGGAALATFTLRDAKSGDPIRGARPLGWMTLRQGEAPPTRKECRDKVKLYLGGLISEQADVDMNAFLLLALNEDATITAINPQIALTRNKLQALITLPGRGADWALHPSKDLLYVTVPGANRVAVVDTLTLRSSGSFEVGQRPVRIAVEPDGRTAFVGSDGDDTVIAFDARKLETRRVIPVGPGHKELAISGDGKLLWATAAGADTAVAVDVATLETVGEAKVGKGVAALAASRAAGAVYAANGRTGDIVVLGDRERAARSTIPAEPGLVDIAFDPAGRFAVAVNEARGTAIAIDAATAAPVATFGQLQRPDQVVFSEDFAYVRHLGGTRVSMIRLDQLTKARPAPPAAVEMTHYPAEAAEHGAPVIAPVPDGDSVMVAGLADRAVYFYREGMIAPMATHPNYGRRPLSVMVLDRSLSETAPGVYSTTVRIKDPGVYDVQFLLDEPRRTECLEARIEGPAAADGERGPRVDLRPAFDPDARLTAGQEVTLKFTAHEKGGQRAIDAQDVQVVLFRMPGTWRWNGAPKALGGGEYEVTFTPPAPGQYKLVVGIDSWAAPMGSLAPFTLGVEEPRVAGGKPARAEGNR